MTGTTFEKIATDIKESMTVEALLQHLDIADKANFSDEEKKQLFNTLEVSGLFGKERSLSASSIALISAEMTLDIKEIISDIQNNPDIKENIEFYALQKSLTSNKLDIAENLLKDGVNPNAKPPADEDLPHIFEALNHSPEALDLLIAYGADVNLIRQAVFDKENKEQPDYNFYLEDGHIPVEGLHIAHQTPLDYIQSFSAGEHQQEMTDCLVKHGALTYRDVKRQSFSKKIRSASTTEQLVQILDGANKAGLSDKEQKNVLLAMEVSGLIGKGVSSCRKAWAEAVENCSIGNMLGNIQKNPQILNEIKYHSLEKAIETGTPEMVENLLNSGINPNDTPPSKNTPPHIFNAVRQKPQYVDLLVAHGANINTIFEQRTADGNANCQTPLDYFLSLPPEELNPAMLDCLERRGAKTYLEIKVDLERQRMIAEKRAALARILADKNAKQKPVDKAPKAVTKTELSVQDMKYKIAGQEGK